MRGRGPTSTGGSHHVDGSWVRLEKPMPGTAALATAEAPGSRVQLLHRRVERTATCRVQFDRHALYLAIRDTQNDIIDEFVGGPRFELGRRKAPTATVLPCGHELRALARGKGETEYVAVYLDDAIFEEILAGFERSAGRLEILPIAGSRDPFLLAAGMRLKQELGGEDCYRGIAIELICQDLALHLIRFHSNLRLKPQLVRHDLADGRISRARDFIHANLGRVVCLADMATVAGMSRYHFARCFHRTLGDPPHRYLLKQRIELAKLLLRRPAISIVEVALQCGFVDQGHFGRRFKELVGVTPRSYRGAMRA